MTAEELSQVALDEYARWGESEDNGTMPVDPRHFMVLTDEIKRLRVDLAIQAVNAKTVTDLQDALGKARSYILDHGEDFSMAPVVDLIERALGFVPLHPDVGDDGGK